MPPANPDGPSAWTVTLADGTTIELRGRRVVITASGALMVLNSSGWERQVAVGPPGVGCGWG